ncbi:MAG: hypothetical protein AAF806_30080 [Bacteroidota bacterium]
MRWIKKNKPPASFETYIRAEFASFDAMDKEVKDELRNALLAEQFGICAYCQQRLRIRFIKIEHHCEQSICNGTDGTKDRRLDYSNLFAVCKGNEGLKDNCTVIVRRR